MQNTTETKPKTSPSFWRSMVVVAWAFCGIRNSGKSTVDVAQVSPIHVIVAGILGAALVVLACVGMVNWVLP